MSAGTFFISLMIELANQIRTDIPVRRITISAIENLNFTVQVIRAR